MKAKIFVTLRNGVLDPQGKAIHHAVELLGMDKIRDVRQGKYFEIELDDALNHDEAHEAVTKIARDVLANPVIEDFQIEIN